MLKASSGLLGDYVDTLKVFISTKFMIKKAWSTEIFILIDKIRTFCAFCKDFFFQFQFKKLQCNLKYINKK